MVYEVLSAKLAPGAAPEAMEWLRKYAKYHNDNFEECTVEVLRLTVGSPMGKVLVIIKYESAEARGKSGYHSKDPGMKAIFDESKPDWFLDTESALYHPLELG